MKNRLKEIAARGGVKGMIYSRACLPFIAVGVVAGALLFSPPVGASLPLETESARIMNPGMVKVETAFEGQVSADGKEVGVPIAIEYAITKDIELQIEPVPITTIRPSTGSPATGIGDTEGTAVFRFVHEDGWVPNVALAGEVKIPTARNRFIGTGRFDYTGYFVVSERLGPADGPGSIDLHFNLGYTYVGKPPGVNLKNTFDFAFAADYHITSRMDLLAEALATTSSSPTGLSGTGEGGTALTPEAAGGEIVGLLGVRYQVVHGLYISTGLTFDNNQAVLLRQGLTWKFDTR